MTSQPRSFLTLKKLIASSPDTEELVNLISQFMGDKHDRGAALSMVALLDGAMKDAILAVCNNAVHDKPEYLFGPNAPLRSLSAKIRFSFAFHLCDEAAADDMECLREVRNAFAHTMKPISFEMVEVQNVCNRIKLWDRIKSLFPAVPELSSFDPGTRNRFMIAGAFYATAFHDLSRGHQSDFTRMLWLTQKSVAPGPSPHKLPTQVPASPGESIPPDQTNEAH